MWPFLKPINLLRYLIVWRVNSSLAWLPGCLSTELSLVLGKTIAERLPTREARPWQKALAPWDDHQSERSRGRKKKPGTVPEVSWPIEAVILGYPGKLTYGRGELILWELKLAGESADHGLFLEIILPAMEEASRASDSLWSGSNKLWGHFDIDAVYAARGPQWEPLVRDGRLDLRYRANPVQWAEGFAPDVEPARAHNRLTWTTPFDLAEIPGVASAPVTHSGRGRNRPRNRRTIALPQVPTLQDILQALIVRISLLLPGKHNTPDDVWNILDPEEQSALREAIEQAGQVGILHNDLDLAPKHWPGCWTGTQVFGSIPHSILAYLELASILHIGKQTHFGCGTFMVT